MSASPRILIAGLLAALALGLLAFGGLWAWNAIRTLEADRDFYLSRVIELEQGELRFRETVQNFDVAQTMDELVAAEDRALRVHKQTKITVLLRDLPVPYGTARMVSNTVSAMVDSDDKAQRQALRDEIYINLFGVANPGPPQEASVVVAAKAFASFTSLLTVLGGAASGLVSLMMFFSGGGRRSIEEDMLGVDLEMKRVELAKARFAAREALDHRDAE